MKMLFHCEDLGGTIQASAVGFYGGEQELRERERSTMRTWEYTVKNAPSAKYIIELKLK